MTLGWLLEKPECSKKICTESSVLQNSQGGSQQNDKKVDQLERKSLLALDVVMVACHRLANHLDTLPTTRQTSDISGPIFRREYLRFAM